MKAIQVNKTDRGPGLILVELQKPEPGLGEILIHVHAAGVTPTELLWYPTTHTKSGTARVRALPGHEFSGVIAAIGKDVQDFEIGDEVYGMNDWFADGPTAPSSRIKSSWLNVGQLMAISAALRVRTEAQVGARSSLARACAAPKGIPNFTLSTAPEPSGPKPYLHAFRARCRSKIGAL